MSRKWNARVFARIQGKIRERVFIVAWICVYHTTFWKNRKLNMNQEQQSCKTAW